MTTFVLATQVSREFLSIVVREHHNMAGDVVILDTDDNAHAQLKQSRLSSIALRPNSQWGWPERDENFKRLFMPGAQLGESFPGTALAIWKPMALDRLSFWYTANVWRKALDYCLALHWDKAIVSADLTMPLPFALARHAGKPVEAVKVGTLRTREWWDLLSVKPDMFSRFWVTDAVDVQFLGKLNVPNVAVV